MSEEEQSFGSDLTGLKEAAKLTNDLRETGLPISQPEPLPKESEAPPPVDRRWETEAPESGREKAVIDWAGTDGKVSARDASERLAERRQQEALVSEGDAELRRELEKAAELSEEEVRRVVENLDDASKDRIMQSVEGVEAERERLAQAAAAAEAQLQAITADRDAKIREIEQRKANEAAAAERERRLAEYAQGASDLPKIEHELLTNIAQKYPDAANQFGVEKLRQENPSRYAEYVRDFQIAETIYKAKALDELTTKASIHHQQAQVQAQRTHESQAAAQQVVEVVRQNHPEYADQAKVDRDIASFVAARRARGQSDAEISAVLNDPRNFNAATLEGWISEARTYRGQQELRNGRRNPVRPVQRPGARGDGVERATLGALEKRAEAKGDPKSWGKWLAQARREARR